MDKFKFILAHNPLSAALIAKDFSWLEVFLYLSGDKK